MVCDDRDDDRCTIRREGAYMMEPYSRHIRFVNPFLKQ